MFIENLLTAAQQVAILYILVAVGFIADKTGIYTEKAARLCTDLLFYIITPAKIIQSFLLMDYDSQAAQGLAVAAGCGALIHIISATVSFLVFNKSPSGRAAIFKYSCAYGNCGYMALPLASAVLGTQGVFYCSAVIMSFQIFSFTHGIWLMSHSDNGEKVKFDFKRIFINPGTISVIIGLPLFLMSIRLPMVIEAPIDYLAELNTPIAMLIFGTYLANTNAKAALKEWRILTVALVKLIIIPCICLGLFKLFGLSGTLLTSLIISASAPTANNTVMFAAKYDKDTGLASQTVAIVSFLSIITMPVFIGISSVV